MSCEECKEQVFELIEREAIDPEGVRAVLAECPDCRQEFDALKASLALAGQLPFEEPPAGIDAAILNRAAQALGAEGSAPARGASEGDEVVPFHKRLLQAPQWAMAAVALLAVGVGVWSIPRDVQLESDVAPAPPAAPAVEEVEAVTFGDAEAAPPTEAVARLDRRGAGQLAEAPRGKEQNAAKAGDRPARKLAARAKKRREAPAAQRPAPSFDEDDFALGAAGASPAAESKRAEASEQAVVSRSAADSAANEPAASRGAIEVEERAAEGETNAQEQSRCQTKVAAFEKRVRSERRYQPAPEEQLAIGRCYQALGKKEKARRWLERAAAHPATKDRATEALRSLSGQ